MRFPSALLIGCGVAVSALAPATPVQARPHRHPAPPALPAPVVAQLAVVAKARQRALYRGYPDALAELAKRYRDAAMLPQAYQTAMQAAEAYDHQLELRHDLSEAVSDPVRGRAERSAAHDLGLGRDKARFFAAGVAEQQGQPDKAIEAYLLVVRSQPGEGLGLDALAALGRLGWLAPAATGEARP